MNIEFNTSISDGDWVKAVGGWRCDALLIPGAKLEALYHDGIKADTGSFTIESSIIRWFGSSKPKELLIRLSLTKDLTKLEEEKLQLEKDKLTLTKELPKLEEEKLQLEKDKLNLERQKSSIETKWKIITAIGAILGSLLTFGSTYILEKPKTNAFVTTPPRIHTYTGVMSVTENQCIASLTKILENYGLQNVTTVQKGVYANKGNYNIFVGCNTDIKAIFLVVSGPEDSECKRLREDIKSQFDHSL